MRFKEGEHLGAWIRIWNWIKDSSLMGSFPLSTLNPSPTVAMVNTILPLSRQSLGSYDPRIVPSTITSLLLVSQDLFPLPSSSPSEHITISNHKVWRSLPSASSNHVGGKVPTSIHHYVKKLANGYCFGKLLLWTRGNLPWILSSWFKIFSRQINTNFLKVFLQITNYRKNKQVRIEHIPYQSMLNPFHLF